MPFLCVRVCVWVCVRVRMRVKLYACIGDAGKQAKHSHAHTLAHKHTRHITAMRCYATTMTTTTTRMYPICHLQYAYATSSTRCVCVCARLRLPKGIARQSAAGATESEEEQLRVTHAEQPGAHRERLGVQTNDRLGDMWVYKCSWLVALVVAAAAAVEWTVRLRLKRNPGGTVNRTPYLGACTHTWACVHTDSGIATVTLSSTIWLAVVVAKTLSGPTISGGYIFADDQI